MSLISLDSSLLISFYDDDPDRWATSTMTHGELLVKPLQMGDLELAGRYERAFASGEFDVIAFDAPAARHFAVLRANRALKPPDAIQLACASAAGVDLFITNDDHLAGIEAPGVKFITSLAKAPL